MAVRRKRRNGSAKKAPRPRKRSSLELEFERLWRLLAPPGWELEPEVEFAKPERRWRIDFAVIPPGCVDAKVGVELDGGIFGRRRCRHVTGIGFMNDAHKRNAAIERGWVVLHYTAPDLKQRPDDVIEQVVKVTRMRMA